MAKSIQWVKRWSIEMSSTPILPGVWKRKDGGHVVRARVKNPKNECQEEILKVLKDEEDPKRAFAWLNTERERVRRGTALVEIPIWSAFASQLFKDKLEDRSISTTAGKKKWSRILANHLFNAPWAHHYLDRVTHAELVEWRSSLARLGWVRVIKKNGKEFVSASGDRYAPTTINDWLAIARVIWKAAAHKYQLPKDPMAGVKDFTTDTHRTYTVEEPNALAPEERAMWFATAREMYPQFFAMIFVGFALGQRACTLRPLRRKGPLSDVDWRQKKIHIRRSNTVKDEVEDFTKTKRDQEVPLPDALIDLLRWHCDTQMVTWQMRESDLLFPNRDGGFRSGSCLDKPFAAITAACGINKRITPRAMRRTFQDVSRDAEVDAIVAQAISGHETPKMRKRYSTAQQKEMVRGIAKVIDLVTRAPEGQKAG